MLKAKKWIFLMVVLNLCHGISAAELSNGRRVILNRGLQIQSLIFINNTVWPTNFSLWKSANFTTGNSWYTENLEKNLVWTLPWGRWMKTDGSNPLTTNEKNQHLSELICLQYGDELNQDTNPGTAGTFDATTLAAMSAAYADWRGQFGSNFLDVSGNLIISGTNSTGWAGSTYSILTSTDLTSPLDSWMTNATGSFGSNGVFSNAVEFRTSEPQRFFIIKTP